MRKEGGRENKKPRREHERKGNHVVGGRLNQCKKWEEKGSVRGAREKKKVARQQKLIFEGKNAEHKPIDHEKSESGEKGKKNTKSELKGILEGKGRVNAKAV